MRTRPLILLLALAALALFVAGCGDDDEEPTTEPAATPTGTTGATGEDGGGGGAGASSVSMTEFEFDPSDLTVSEGDTIEVTNDGQVPHNFTVTDDGLATEDLEGGASEELTVDLAPGEYEFVCTIADHEAQGMTGTMTVE
jgi:plastocyanin